MSKGRLAMKIIGTFVLCFSSIYYTLFYLCESESIKFVHDILCKDPLGYLFDSYYEGIFGALASFFVISFFGFVFLAIAYRMSKKLIPVAVAFFVLPIAAFYLSGVLETIVFHYITVIFFVALIIFTYFKDKRFTPFMVSLALADPTHLLGAQGGFSAVYSAVAVICSVLSLAVFVYAIYFAVHTSKVKDAKEINV